MKYSNSIKAYQEAQKIIPGGVNSPVRAFKSVQADPLYITKGEGAYITDLDQNQYIDYVASWGPMLLGHSHPAVKKAILEQIEKGTGFGAPTVEETKLAELICEMVPSAESVRMVNSGTEATMSALRLARGYTGKELFIKFEGCYHGHADSFLIKAGSGAMTLGLPDSPGVTKGTAQDTLTAEFNNKSSVENLFEAYGDKIAAVIIEPVAGNMGTIPPEEGFLEFLREITQKHGTLLIFDEVMTGFRLAAGGAQELYGVRPDITTLGKIIGGGLPVGAFAGKKEIMEQLAPKGSIYQAGTLSGNPLAVSAGYATLSEIQANPDFYQKLEEKGKLAQKGLQDAADKAGIPVCINRVGSMITMFFTELSKVISYKDAASSDTEKYAAYFKGMLKEGVYLAPSQFESGFISAAHTETDIRKTAEAAEKVLTQIC